MLYPQHFFNDTYRKNVIAFGSLFQNIQIVRFDSTGNEHERVRVPLTFGPKEKWYYATQQNPDLLNPTGVTFPRLVYEVQDMRYDPQRKNFNLHRLQKDVTTTTVNVMAPAPYNLRLILTSFTTTEDEGLQIAEQILPFFTPDVTLSLKLMPALEHKVDVPVILQTVKHANNWQTDWSNFHYSTWSFHFLMKTYFYGPTRTSKIVTSQTTTVNSGQPGSYETDVTIVQT